MLAALLKQTAAEVEGEHYSKANSPRIRAHIETIEEG
jgi:hypothetical protein